MTTTANRTDDTEPHTIHRAGPLELNLVTDEFGQTIEIGSAAAGFEYLLADEADALIHALTNLRRRMSDLRAEFTERVTNGGTR